METVWIITLNLTDNWKVLHGAFVAHFLDSYDNYLDQIIKTIPKDKGNCYENLQTVWKETPSDNIPKAQPCKQIQ
jgi:hypothetical protein